MSQATSQSNPSASHSKRWILIGALGILVLVVGLFYRQWLPKVQQLLAGETGATKAGEAARTEQNRITIMHGPRSRRPRRCQLDRDERPGPQEHRPESAPRSKLQSFTKTISVPGMIVERPGRSTVEVTAPMTGIVTRIYTIEGEAVEPGAKLFELRLTHEELVQSQAELLQTAEELDVIGREIEAHRRADRNRRTRPASSCWNASTNSKSNKPCCARSGKPYCCMASPMTRSMRS